MPCNNLKPLSYDISAAIIEDELVKIIWQKQSKHGET